MLVSIDTLLRVVRRRARESAHRLVVIGIDDFAWRRNHPYGTTVCDLEPTTGRAFKGPRAGDGRGLAKGATVDLIVARDRGGRYGEAVKRALPDAIQVADRWHLMENASRPFLDAVRASMRQIRLVVGATVINPDLLTSAERLQ